MTQAWPWPILPQGQIGSYMCLNGENFYKVINWEKLAVNDQFFRLFSGTVRPRRLNLVTHVDNERMYCVYWNHAAAFIRPFIYSFFFLSKKNEEIKGRISSRFLHFSFSPIFKHWNFSSHFSQELWGLEGCNLVHTCTVGRCIVYTKIRFLPLICSFIFLSLQFSNIKMLFF